MNDWLARLPIGWMAVAVFAAIYLATVAIWQVVVTLARGERARAFKAVSPGLLPVMGVVFALCCCRSSRRRRSPPPAGRRRRPAR